MSAVYLESSAVLSWLLEESRSAGMRSVIDGADLVFASVLTLVEAERGLIRAEWGTQISAAERRRLTGLLAREKDAWNLFDVSAEVRARAGQPFPVEPVRTLDALHLSTALVLSKGVPDLQLVSLDRRICQNAEALGLDTAS